MCKEAWSKLPFLVKSVAIITPVTFLFLVLGFAVPIWIKFSGNIPTTVTNIHGDVTGVFMFDNFGLWQICGSDHGCIPLKDIPAYLIATRFFVTVGFIGSFFVTVAVSVFVLVPDYSGSARLSVVIFISSLVVAGCLLLGVIIFGAEVKYFLNFGYACTCISTILYAIMGGLMGLHICSNK